jgi:hypothetical protein
MTKNWFCELEPDWETNRWEPNKEEEKKKKKKEEEEEEEEEEERIHSKRKIERLEIRNGSCPMSHYPTTRLPSSPLFFSQHVTWSDFELAVFKRDTLPNNTVALFGTE